MSSSVSKNPDIFAVCGKGGVGKTSISAFITKILADREEIKVLAIDADPAIGLGSTLGFNPRITVDDVRNDLIGRVEDGRGGDKKEIVSLLDYGIFDAIEERGNIAFLAIGRPEKEGCYCKVNVILKDIITEIAQSFDYVVIDGEAGIEQINRRVMEKVNHLVMVSDASAKGLNVIKTIKDVSDRMIKYKNAGLILNRIRDEDEKNRLSIPEGIDLLGWVPEDDTIRNYDIDGRSLLDVSECPAFTSIRGCIEKMVK
jgi:CO dehydrogenase maturation factor